MRCECGHIFLRFEEWKGKGTEHIFRSRCSGCHAVYEFVVRQIKPPTKAAENKNS